MFFRLAKLCLFIIPFTVLVVSTGTLFPFIVGKYVLFRALTFLSAGFFLLGLMFESGAEVYLAELKRLFRSPVVWALTAFVFIFVLAGFTGMRPSFSFWSNFERGEGGFQMITLYVFFLMLAALFRERADWKRLFWLTIIVAVLMGVYGFCAGLKYLDAERTIVMQNGEEITQFTGEGGPWFNTFRMFVGPEFGPTYRFQGSIGNPAYVAGYLLFVLFYMSMLFLWARGWLDKRKAAGFGLLGVYLLAMFYSAGTRGAFLGLLSGLFVGAVVFAFLTKDVRRRRVIFAAVAVVIVLAGLMVTFRGTPLVKAIPGSRIFDISLERLVQGGQEGTFGTRTVMWSIAWRAWQERPLLGYGPENFIWVFDRFFDTRYYHPGQGFSAWFDRAHSIIFDYLAATGILGLLSFLSIFAALGLLLFRAARGNIPSADGPSPGPVFLAFVAGLAAAYLVQGIVLFDVLTIYVNLFIFLAFALYLFLPPAEGRLKEFRPGAPAFIAGFGGLVFALAAIYAGAILPYVKASRFIGAEARINSVRNLQEFEDNFDHALKYYSPVGDEEVSKFLSNDVMGILPRIDSEVAARELARYIEEPLLAGHLQNDVRHQIIVAQLHVILWHNFKDESDFQASERAFLKARELGPTLPQPLEGLHALYLLHGDNDKAMTIREHLISLWPEQKALLESVTTSTATSSE